MRIIALDLGTKKCGIAITDPLQIISQPLVTIFYNNQDFDFLINELKQVINMYNPIETIVVGFPKNIDNSISPTGKIVLKFKSMLQSNFPRITIVLFDEKYTSKDADKVMLEMNLNKKQKKISRDKIAAQKILENFLLFKK